jgi:ankyrin repeat protein
MGNSSSSRVCGRTADLFVSNIFSSAESSSNPLISAILNEDITQIDECLAKMTHEEVDREYGVTLAGADNRLTPLMVAASKGNTEAIGHLLRSGKCTVTVATTAHGRTALMTAAEQGQTAAVEALFAAGA